MSSERTWKCFDLLIPRFDSDNIERVCIVRSISLDLSWVLMRDSCSCSRLPGDDVSKCQDGTMVRNKLFRITGTTKSYFCKTGNGTI